MADSRPEEAIRKLRLGVDSFARDAHSLLSRFETAEASRVVSVAYSRKQLFGLTLEQEDLFDESLKCISHGLYRAAIASAWLAFMDFLDSKLESDGLVKVRACRPKWIQSGSIDDLRESVNEYQRIEVAKELGLIDKATMKSLHGMLSTRNSCSHPGGYNPSFNSSLGFVSDLLDRTSLIQPKSL